MTFSKRERDRNLKTLQEEVFDLVIVGGGIMGAGMARDASSRGMKVALVEAKDFAFGTSSRSSKLIHGGLRYLENFNFSLVFEALSERAVLFKIAPHLVHPLRFLIPVYRNSRVGYWKLLAGLWFYDLLALLETPKMHESLSKSEVNQRAPGLKSSELIGAVEYSDAYTDDDRLVIETLRDAHRRGTLASNYLKMVSAQVDSHGLVHWIQVRDELSGNCFKVCGRQYVSGVGPWTDFLGRAIDKKWKSKLRPTKGIHLVFSKKTIPIEKAVVMAVEERIIFVIPRHDMVIVGTTDTDYERNPEEVSVQAEDVDYLLKVLNQYFPYLQIREQDIVSSYSGVRPLVDDGSLSEGQTSREHSIFSHGPNLSFVAGGKYTTYRKISEEVIDHVLGKMNFEVAMGFGSSRTRQVLNPKITPALYQRSQTQVVNLAKQYGLQQWVVDNLVKRYGDEALWILEKIRSEFQKYPADEALWMGEAAFAIEQTMCIHLVDFYWRRSHLFLAHRDHGHKYIRVISEVFAKYYDWSVDELEKQSNHLLKEIQKELTWKKNPLQEEKPL